MLDFCLDESGAWRIRKHLCLHYLETATNVPVHDWSRFRQMIHKVLKKHVLSVLCWCKDSLSARESPLMCPGFLVLVMDLTALKLWRLAALLPSTHEWCWSHRKLAASHQGVCRLALTEACAIHWSCPALNSAGEQRGWGREGGRSFFVLPYCISSLSWKSYSGNDFWWFSKSKEVQME